MEQKDFAGITTQIREVAEQAGAEQAERQHLISIERQISAIARGDLDAALANAAPDVQLDIFAPREFQWIAHARGVDEMRRAIAVNFASVIDQAPAILNVIAQGDTVVLMGSETGRIRATGEPYDVEFVQKFTFADGRLVAVRIIAAKRLEKDISVTLPNN